MADYILNMGGSDELSHRTNVVNVFKVTKKNVELITDHNLSLSIKRNGLAAATCGSYVFALGGTDAGGGSTLDTVDIFRATENGVEAVPDHGLTLSQARYSLTAAAAGNYVLTLGGWAGRNAFSNVVDVFKVTQSGVEAVPDHGLSLSVGRSNLTAAGCRNYILALGGTIGSAYSNTVDVFKVTENGVEAVPDHGLSLSEARSGLRSAVCGNYILALGGYKGGTPYYSDVVDVFKITENGVEHITDHGLSLSVARNNFAAAACGEYVLAMGGSIQASPYKTNVIDVFHVTENKMEHITDHGLSLTVVCNEISAASAGNFILAMGGYTTSNTVTNAVDIFQIIK